jgi:DNA recombination protein RmuC
MEGFGALAATHGSSLGAFVIGGLLASAVVIAIYRRRSSRALEAARQQWVVEQQQASEVVEERLNARERELSWLKGRLDVLDEELTDARAALHSRDEALTENLAQQAALKVRLEETRNSFADKEQLFKDSSMALKQEFELLANRIFAAQGERHSENLATLLTPFRDQIGDFRARIEEVYHNDGKDRASLLTEVKILQEASKRINEETENLTRALKGDVKAQGDWGEVVLERILEESGLRSGVEYFTQESRRSETGELKRPDVRVALPGGKDVIIDAKVSLLAYEQANSATTDAVRERALRAHMTSLRGHIKKLAEQDYDQLEEVRSLDFVLLFIPIESAFMLAMEQDHKLFNEAFERRIVIVSPTTLMMTLRVINNVWRFDKQNRNAEEIARKAGALYDKLRGLLEDMDTLGKQLATAEKTYQAAFNKITSGKGNLVGQVEAFRELGARVKKPLPKVLRDPSG